MLSEAGARSQRLTSLTTQGSLQDGSHLQWWKPENGNNDSCQGVIEQGIYFATASAVFIKCCRAQTVLHDHRVLHNCLIAGTELCIIWCQQRCGVTFFLSDWTACFCDLKINCLQTMCFRVSADECERRWRRVYRTNRWVNRLRVTFPWPDEYGPWCN